MSVASGTELQEQCESGPQRRRDGHRQRGQPHSERQKEVLDVLQQLQEQERERERSGGGGGAAVRQLLLEQCEALRKSQEQARDAQRAADAKQQLLLLGQVRRSVRGEGGGPVTLHVVAALPQCAEPGANPRIAVRCWRSTR